MTDESRKLQEDIRRMMSGAAPMRQREETEDRDEDREDQLDEAMGRAREQLIEKVREVLRGAIQKDSLHDLMRSNSIGVDIGPLGCNKVVDEVMRGFEMSVDNLSEDVENANEDY